MCSTYGDTERALPDSLSTLSSSYRCPCSPSSTRPSTPTHPGHLVLRPRTPKLLRHPPPGLDEVLGRPAANLRTRSTEQPNDPRCCQLDQPTTP